MVKESINGPESAHGRTEGGRRPALDEAVPVPGEVEIQKEFMEKRLGVSSYISRWIKYLREKYGEDVPSEEDFLKDFLEETRWKKDSKMDLWVFQNTLREYYRLKLKEETKDEPNEDINAFTRKMMESTVEIPEDFAEKVKISSYISAWNAYLKKKWGKIAESVPELAIDQKEFLSLTGWADTHEVDLKNFHDAMQDYFNKKSNLPVSVLRRKLVDGFYRAITGKRKEIMGLLGNFDKRKFRRKFQSLIEQHGNEGEPAVQEGVRVGRDEEEIDDEGAKEVEGVGEEELRGRVVEGFHQAVLRKNGADTKEGKREGGEEELEIPKLVNEKLAASKYISQWNDFLKGRGGEDNRAFELEDTNEFLESAGWSRRRRVDLKSFCDALRAYFDENEEESLPEGLSPNDLIDSFIKSTIEEKRENLLRVAAANLPKEQ